MCEEFDVIATRNAHKHLTICATCAVFIGNVIFSDVMYKSEGCWCFCQRILSESEHSAGSGFLMEMFGVLI